MRTQDRGTFSDEQLRRMTRDKQPRTRQAGIGLLARQATQAGDPAFQATAAQVRSAVEEAVDDLFRKHCRVIRVEQSKLTIAVDDPSMIYELRRRYLFRLREHLACVVPRARITDVHFCAAC